MLEDQLQKKNYIIQNVNVKLKFIQLILAIFSMLNQFPCKILIKWLKLLKYICYYGKILKKFEKPKTLQRKKGKIKVIIKMIIKKIYKNDKFYKL